MTYIIGFGILVALFATFPRTAILGVVLIIGGFYLMIRAESANNYVAETPSQSYKCSGTGC